MGAVPAEGVAEACAKVGEEEFSLFGAAEAQLCVPGEEVGHGVFLEGVFRDVDLCADADEGEEGAGILRGEADAAVRYGGAEAGGICCAVDVDVACAGVGVVRFQAVQAEDAGKDGILPPGGGGVQAHGEAAAKDGVRGGVFAVFAANGEVAQGGAAAAFFAAGAGGACGAGEAVQKFAAGLPAYFQLLGGNADAKDDALHAGVMPWW